MPTRSRIRRWRWAWRGNSFAWPVLCSAVVAAAPSALGQDGPRASPSGVEVEWFAPRECPDRLALLRVLNDRTPVDRAAVTLRARAHVSRRGESYRLELELESGSGRASRSLTNAHCRPLVEAAAVLIALAIETEARPIADSQPVAEAQPLEPPLPAPSEPAADAGPVEPALAASAPAALQEPAAQATAEAAPVPDPVALPEISHDEASATRTAAQLHWQLSAALRTDLGTFPHEPALGVQVQVAARLAPLYVALGASYWPAREQRSLSYPSARLRGSGVFFDLGLGADISARPVVLTPALSLELGGLDAEATGIAGPESSRVLWFALGPCVSAAISVRKDWSLALDVSGLVPMYRTRWLVRTPQGDVPAFDAAPVVLRAAIRVGYALR